MKLIEAGLSSPEAIHRNLKKTLSFLQRLGLCNLLFSDFFVLKAFSQQMKEIEIQIAHLYVMSYPNRESIKMIWDIVKAYDSFSIFLKQNESAREEDFKDALYQALSFTDDVGCALEGGALLTAPLDPMIQALQEEFNIKHFLILDGGGLLLPNEVSKCLKTLRENLARGSQIFFFPNDRHGLGLIDAIYAMRVGIDGLVGSILKQKKKKDQTTIDLLKLHFLYQSRKKDLFSSRTRRLLDRTFISFGIS